MTLLLDIPDDITASLNTDGRDPSRSALEAVALHGYRNGRLSTFQIKRMLGLESKLDVHEFLKANNTPLDYTVEDFDKDMQALSTLRERFPIQK